MRRRTSPGFSRAREGNAALAAIAGARGRGRPTPSISGVCRPHEAHSPLLSALTSAVRGKPSGCKASDHTGVGPTTARSFAGRNPLPRHDLPAQVRRQVFPLSMFGTAKGGGRGVWGGGGSDVLVSFNNERRI